jgi:hypothetical protein
VGNKGEKFALFLARTKKTLGECKTIEGKQATWHSFGSGEFLAVGHRIFVQTKFSFRGREEEIFYILLQNIQTIYIFHIKTTPSLPNSCRAYIVMISERY